MKLTIKLNLLMGKTCPEITSTRIASLNATYIWLKSELGNKRGINKTLESMKFLITQSALETSISIFQFYPCRIFQVPYFSKYTFELHLSIFKPILLRILSPLENHFRNEFGQARISWHEKGYKGWGLVKLFIDVWSYDILTVSS